MAPSISVSPLSRAVARKKIPKNLKNEVSVNASLTVWCRIMLSGLLLVSLGLLVQPTQTLVLPARASCAWPRRCTVPVAIERVPGPRTAALPPPVDLADEVMLRIVQQEMTDMEVNALVWKYLGYRYDSAAGTWDASGVFPNWRKNYPQPPDLVGITRTYTREVDEPVLRAVQSLQKSVAKEHKNNLRAFLKPLGWNVYKMEGLTPNMTRRAQVANWLLYYREALHGVSVEELRRRREERAAAEAARVAAGEVMAPTGTAAQSVV